MPASFAQRLSDRVQTLNTRLCLGLDPRLSAYPSREELRAHTLAVLDTCAPYVAVSYTHLTLPTICSV